MNAYIFKRAIIGLLFTWLTATTNLTLASENDHVPGEVIVKFNNNLGASERASIHEQLGTKVIRTIPGIGAQLVRGAHGQSTDALLGAFQHRPDVKYAEPNFIQHINRTPSDPLFPDNYAFDNTGQTDGTPDADIDAPEAWARQTGSADIVVADIDTGVDYTHEDLAANMWTNAGETPGNGFDDDGNGYVDDYYGWDFYSFDSDPMDDHSHGTHTSGTMAAVGDNGIGVTGVSWRSRIMALKFMDENGYGSSTAAAEAIIYAADMGARVANNSWGSSQYSQTVEDAIAYADSKGVLFVAAAGNNASDNDELDFYPCNSTLPNVICVASTDHNDDLSLFAGGIGSNYGTTTVDLGAPGAEILSTVPVGGAYDDDIPGDGYGYVSGTSMAAPHVSGAAALLLAEYPLLSQAEVREMLLGTVDPLESLAGITVTGGRLNLDSALKSNFLVAGSPARQSLWMGESTIYTVSVSSLHGFSTPVMLSLVSSDPSITGSFDAAIVTPPEDGSAESTLTVQTTAVTPRGAHALLLVASDGLGETRTATILLDVSGPDFGISVAPDSDYVGTDGSVNTTVTVTGLDGYSGPINLDILSDDPAIGGVFDPAAVIVPVDGTATSTLTLTITSQALIGDHNLDIEGYDGTRVHAAPYSLWVNDVDLVVTDVSTLTSVVPVGNYFSTSTTLANQGSEDAMEEFPVWFYISTDGTLAGNVALLYCQPYITGLAAGESTTVNCDNVKMPTTLSSGTYYIVAYVDYGNRQPEADEDNNVSASPAIEVVPADVDLVVDSVSAQPTAAIAGSPLTVTSTVANQGASAIYASVTVGLYLSEDATITTSDVLLGNRYIYSLAGGDSSTADTVVVIPTGMAPGSYYIGAIADKYDAQLETNETNNALAGHTIEVLTETLFEDGFESGDFATGGWNPDGRDATVSKSAAYTGVYGASLKRSASIEKVFSTEGYTGITIKYRRQASGFGTGENLYVEWYDGGAWQKLETVNSASYDDGLQVKTCGAAADNNPAFRLRFRTTGNRMTEFAYIDDVEITAGGL